MTTKDYSRGNWKKIT